MGSKKNKKKSKQINLTVDRSEIAAATGGNPFGIRPNVKIILIILSAILLLTIVVYSNSISNGFVNWDDGENVYDNIYIRELSFDNIKIYFTKALISMYTPLVYISYALDYMIGELDPRIYHATNLLLHLLNITLLFFIVRLLTKRIEIAAIVALLFAVHPLNTGAVAPVSTRSGLLYSFFSLAAFLFYIRYLKNDFRVRYLIWALVLFLMALLSKSAAVVLPLVLLLTDYYCKRKFDARAVAEKIPFFVLSLIFGILTFVFREDVGHMGSQYVFSAFDRIFLAGYSIVFYLFKVFIPIKLSAYYPYPVKIGGLLPLWFYPTPLVIAAFIFLIYKLRNYRRELIFGSLFFLINIILVLKILPIGGEIVCDRYAYLPYIGLFLIIGWAYCWIIDRFNSPSGWINYFLIIAVVVYSIAFSVVSYERNKVWKDSLTLFNDVLEKYPLVDVAYNNRGNAKIELRKDYAGAMEDFNKSLELNPGNAIAYSNRGRAKIELRKDYAGAMEDFNKSIELDPSYMLSYFNRALLRMEQKNYEGALADYNRVLEIDPHISRAYYGRGNIKVFRKDYEGAADEYSKAIALNPDYAEAYRNRGNMRMLQERYGDAVADYSEVLRLNPQNAGVYFKRAWSRWFTSDRDGACADWRKSFELGTEEAAAIMQMHCLK
ncbi:MAG: tetratricopeptide repeat protein [Syntrophus sp. (in: bacteria)]